MRNLCVFFACTAGLMGSSALAQESVPGPVPGPFACSIGDVGLMLYPNDDATEFSGTYEVGGEYAQDDGSEPEKVTLTQRHSNWRYVYSSTEMTMIVAGDSATIYGDFGESDCFASRSIAVEEGWQLGTTFSDPSGGDGWRSVSGSGERWRETEASGTVFTWGGNVRAGPGQDFTRVGGVPLGVEVELLAETDRRWLEGYPWYKVRLPGGKSGYIAGGLLCSREGREGTFNSRNCEG